MFIYSSKIALPKRSGSSLKSASRLVRSQPAAPPQPRRGAAPAAAPSDVRILDAQTASTELLQRIDTLVLDCDGVLWRGSELVPHAAAALTAFRSAGKRLLFVTNNSSKSRQGYVSKFAQLGLDVAAEEIVPASYAAAAFLASAAGGGFTTTHGSGSSGGGRKKVLLLGSTGCEEELRGSGIEYVKHVPDLRSTEQMVSAQPDPAIGAVLVGWDPDFSYSSLVYASMCLRELPDCLFVATNGDAYDKIGGAAGRMMPGTGCLVAAVEVAVGRKAEVVGKGGTWLLPFLLRTCGLDDPRRAAIVGDRLDTDIALGKQGGLTTILPLTGVCSLDDVAACSDDERPDFVVASIATLAGIE